MTVKIRKVICLPTFNYLQQTYAGNYFHMENGVIYNLDVKPNYKFKSIDDINLVYTELNKLKNLSELKPFINQKQLELKVGNFILNLSIDSLTIQLFDGEVKEFYPSVDYIVYHKGIIPTITITINFEQMLHDYDLIIKNLTILENAGTTSNYFRN